MTNTAIPIIDLFAGPGGLGEGFSAARAKDGSPYFDVKLSIEKDPIAHRTLQLRSFFRSFGNAVPDAYYDFIEGRIDRAELFATRTFRARLEEAQGEAWCLTLAKDTRDLARRRVASLIGGTSNWVLIGGPPCQAYSLVGRSRMRSTHDKFESDARHFLYQEYLQIIQDHAPAVFIMENVKGLLSSTIGGKSMIRRILDDLSRPGGGGLRYRVVGLGASGDLFGTPSDYVLRSENYGIPQARHRVILCGIREDLVGRPEPLSTAEQRVDVDEAIAELPGLRSKLSREVDSRENWQDALAQGLSHARRKAGKSFADVVGRMEKAVLDSRSFESSGNRFVRCKLPVNSHQNRFQSFIRDSRIGGVVLHEARGHMRGDLHRYLFAASFATVRGVSPRLRDFPRHLLPSHENAALENSPFEDRFRVQIGGRPSSTVVSHISKDGHYFIHPDPSQCRSLTVREAARLQTFPDNYFFEGNRTQQFVQVGNAVPPLLALQIAEAVGDFLKGRHAGRLAVKKSRLVVA